MRVSNHAVFRYIERVHGVSISMYDNYSYLPDEKKDFILEVSEHIKSEIPKRTRKAMNEMGCGKYAISNKFVAVLRDKCLVTIY